MKDAKKAAHKNIKKTHYKNIKVMAFVMNERYKILAYNHISNYFIESIIHDTHCKCHIRNGAAGMLIAGIAGNEGNVKTANLINTILALKGKKVSVIDSASLQELDAKRVKAYIDELRKINVDVLILKIDLSDISKNLYNDIKFDIVIYTDKAEKIYEAENSDAVLDDEYSESRSFLKETGIAIVNADDSKLISLLQGKKQKFVTYGFNTKASITTSSIGDTVYKDGFICCLQRTISDCNGREIEPQEYKLKLDTDNVDTHSVLAAASFAIVNGIDLNSLNCALNM